MKQHDFLIGLKEIIKSLENFRAKSKKYSAGHTYYKKSLKKLKLEIRAFLLKLQKVYGKVAIPEEAYTSLNAFLALEKPLPKDCEKLIDNLNINIQDLELNLEENFTERVYDAGSPFDFHTDFRDILSKAENEIFIIEPFINEDLLEVTLRGIDSNLNIKILTNSNNADRRGKFTKISNMFKTQHKGNFETRESQYIHDRGIFINNIAGWVMGQSIKDAGKKPTYLIKLQNPQKLESIYRKIWNSASKVK